MLLPCKVFNTCHEKINKLRLFTGGQQEQLVRIEELEGALHVAVLVKSHSLHLVFERVVELIYDVSSFFDGV